MLSQIASQGRHRRSSACVAWRGGVVKLEPFEIPTPIVHINGREIPVDKVKLIANVNAKMLSTITSMNRLTFAVNVSIKGLRKFVKKIERSYYAFQRAGQLPRR